MKKTIILAGLSLFGTLLPALADSYVTFAATTQVIKTNSISATGNVAAYNGSPFSTTPGPGVSWYFELLVAPTNQTTIDASLAGWTAVAEGTNISIAGRMLGANSPDGQAVLVPGYAPNTFANFAVVGWSANLGSDWNSVFAGRPLNLATGVGTHGLASWPNTSAPAPAGWDPTYASKLDVFSVGSGGWYGISNVGEAVPTAPVGGPYTDIWNVVWVSGLNMNYYQVPEPASFAVLALGVSTFWIFRRANTLQRSTKEL